MKTTRELAQATLTNLAAELIEKQIELKMVQGDKHMLTDELGACTDYESHLRSLIKGIKRKIDWEVRHHGVALGFAEPAKAREDAEDTEGESWKDPV